MAPNLSWYSIHITAVSSTSSMPRALSNQSASSSSQDSDVIHPSRRSLRQAGKEGAVRINDGRVIKHRSLTTYSDDSKCGSSRSTCTTAISLSGQAIIEAGISFDTFAPQFLWLLIIGLPESPITKKVMGTITPIVGLALVHLTIVAVAAAQEGALDQVLIFHEVFDPSMSQLAGMQKLFVFPNFVAEEWPHVLIWDLFVGRAIWIDGLERGINTRLALAFCNFIGPPGLLIHVATCLLIGKGLPSMGYKDEDA